MSTKLEDSDKLRYLFTCMQHSDLTTIKFEEVAKVFGLAVPAARMRYSRLKKALETQQGGDTAQEETLNGGDAGKGKVAAKHAGQTKRTIKSTATGDTINEEVDDSSKKAPAKKRKLAIKKEINAHEET